jgi:hypothetical protein
LRLHDARGKFGQNLFLKLFLFGWWDEGWPWLLLFNVFDAFTFIEACIVEIGLPPIMHASIGRSTELRRSYVSRQAAFIGSLLIAVTSHCLHNTNR